MLWAGDKRIARMHVEPVDGAVSEPRATDVALLPLSTRPGRRLLALSLATGDKVPWKPDAALATLLVGRRAPPDDDRPREHCPPRPESLMPNGGFEDEPPPGDWHLRTT